MKLTTDLSVRKWKPASEGERASCGDSLYLQVYSNGTRAFIFRAQPIVDRKQKSFWVKIGKPAQSNEPSIVGKQLSLANATGNGSTAIAKLCVGQTKRPR